MFLVFSLEVTQLAIPISNINVCGIYMKTLQSKKKTYWRPQIFRPILMGGSSSTVLITNQPPLECMGNVQILTHKKTVN